ncbi:MAG: hypothetical protein JWQ72_2151 [Polaromonas sp.]|nr:hypothetical protein [Polaromonas sp.]
MPAGQWIWARRAIKNVASGGWRRGTAYRTVGAALLLAVAAHGTAGARSRPSHVAQTQTGVVTHVVDGDTLWLRTTSEARLKVRLSGIDAPEMCQEGGAASRAALKRRVAGQTVTVAFARHDDYGRALATVHVHGEDVGRWMVSQGQAWSYAYRRDAGPYAAEQARAQAARLGLFRQASAENPRTFRKRNGSCYSPR